MTTERKTQRITEALDILREGLRPFIDGEMRDARGNRWFEEALETHPSSIKRSLNDVHTLLGILENNWNSVFGRKLGRLERSVVNELREHRNHWAHQEGFSDNDAYRVVDSAERILNKIGASRESVAMRDLRLEVLREMQLAGSATNPHSGGRPTARERPPLRAEVLPPDVKALAIKGKYRPLHDHLRRARGDNLTMTFLEVESVLGCALPPSARKHSAWWANERDGRHVHARAWMDADFRVQLDMNRACVTFVKVKR
jgi:Swt1-like HEPN